MKHMRILLMGLTILAMSGSILLMQGCKDKCEGVTCYNGGVCDNGNCDCPPGFSGSQCQNVVLTYDCVSGYCIPIANGQGQYSSEGECENVCGSGYDCLYGNHCEPVYSGAEYPTLAACENDCNTPNGYYCDNGVCVQVPPQGAPYATLQACEADCN